LVLKLHKHFLVAVVVAATCADVILLGQRQGGPAPAGRQGGGGAPAGRQGGAAPPQGRQGGPQDGGQGGRQGDPRPPRDRGAAQQGTAIIRGRVVSAETGAPVRRAEVQAALGGQRSRGALTDANGRFELRELPAGSWNIRVSKTGFVTQQYGQRAPFAPSEPLTLADGQQLNADFAMLRGGAIIGRVFDDFGEPLANVRVSALRAQLTPNGRRLVSSGGLGTTDDTGAYRLYGLAPGMYYVSAVPQGGSGNGGLSTVDGAVTYGPTYFPGTTDVTGAQRVTMLAGQEQSNIDFAVTAQPSVRVSGIVLGMNGAPMQALVSLRVPLFDDVGSSEPRVANSNADGSFTLRNVPPGNYMLEVTGRRASRDVAPEVAAMPLAVASEITGLTITASRGATITGTITAEAGAGARVDVSGIRPTAPSLRTQQGEWIPQAQVTNTGAFVLEGLIGTHALRFDRLPSGWVVRSVTANGVDVTDVPIDFRGTEQVSVRVVLTNHVTEVAGTVSADVSPRGAGILVFPEDKAKWVSTSRYLRTVRAGDKGEFTLKALPGNQRYLAVALEYLQTGEQLDPEFLERVKPLATSFSLGDGEQKHLELRLSPRP
jgi:hypothetical protein